MLPKESHLVTEDLGLPSVKHLTPEGLKIAPGGEEQGLFKGLQRSQAQQREQEGIMATSELSCQVSEENQERREAFWAEWKDLTLSTRPEEGCSLHEEDTQRHETYHRQGQCQAVVQRSPWLVMRLGILGRGLQEYQLPYQRVLPLPIFTPTKVGAAKEDREETPVQLRELLALETALGGQCAERQDVAEITKQLPPVVPVSKPGTLRRSLSRSMSQEAQRG